MNFEYNHILVPNSSYHPLNLNKAFMFCINFLLRSFFFFTFKWLKIYRGNFARTALYPLLPDPSIKFPCFDIFSFLTLRICICVYTTPPRHHLKARADTMPLYVLTLQGVLPKNKEVLTIYSYSFKI